VITYTAREPSAAAAAVEAEFGTRVHVYHCPGEQSAVVDDVVARVAREVGEVDIVVNNAGVSLWRDVLDTTDGTS
jgi:NAD(P)-dependent dehydrogenase (short-subunit alcohol dehydrogenase family)